MATADSPTKLARGQYSLRAIMILMVGAAVLCAVGAALGQRSVVVLAGVFLCLANYLGFLGLLQRPRVARVVLYVASAAFAISFLLPAVRIATGLSRTEVLPGYSTALVAAATTVVAPFNFLYELVVKPQPPTPGGIGFCLGLLVICSLVATVANLMMTLCPFLVRRIVAGKWRLYQALLVVLPPGIWVIHGHGYRQDIYESLLFGYYVWAGALTIPTIVLPIRIRAFALILMFSIGALSLAHLAKLS